MSPQPARNLVHLLLLGAWAALGLLVTLGALAHPAALPGAGAFWLWFVGFAVATSLLIARTGTPLGALGVHLGVLLLLALVPRVFPLSLLRAGLDVLGRA
ncbi:MAG: hypothetical protein ACXWLF_10835 [Myxococcaceae bacterium]